VGAFQQDISRNPAISPEVREAVSEATTEGIDFVPTAQVQEQLAAAGVPDEEAEEIVSTYADAQIMALKIALLTAAALSLIGLVFTRRLPTEPIARDVPAAAAAPEPSPGA
jgi:hypothetical protein